MKLTLEEIDELIASGPETVIATLKFLRNREVKAEEIRRKDRERKRNSSGIPAERGRNSTENPPSLLSPIPPINSPPSASPIKSKPKRGRAREELELVLDVEHAEAVVEHRKAIRKPLTAFAARLLAKKLGQCDDPNAGAEAMVENGWQGFKPEWLDRLNGKHGPPKRSPIMQAIDELIDETEGNNRGNTTRKGTT